MKSLRFTLLFWLAVVGLIAASLIPNVSLPGTVVTLGDSIRVTKETLAHFTGFALLAWLYVKAHGFSISGILFLLALCVGSEVVQYVFTAGRNIEISDTTHNIFGIGGGLMIGYLERSLVIRDW